MTEVSYNYLEMGNELAGAWRDQTMVNFSFGDIPMIGGMQYEVAAPNELLFRSITLTITPYSVGAGTGLGTMTISVINDLDLQPFSATNLPSTQNTIQVYEAAQTFVDDTPVTISLGLGIDASTDSQFVGGAESALQVLGHGDFQGVIGLVLEYDEAFVVFHGPLAPTTQALAPTFTIDQEPFLSGLTTGKQRQSRADWCPRCGMPMFREQLIKDGYNKSLVCPSCWDPGEHKRRPWRAPKEVNR